MSSDNYSVSRDGKVVSSKKFSGPPTGGDDGGSAVEARIARLESDVEYIKRDVGEIKTGLSGLRADLRSDFKTLWGALFFIALGLAGIMAKGFGWF